MNTHCLSPLARAGKNALDILLRRMQAGSDISALSKAIGAISRIASSEKEGVNERSNNILKDFALSLILLDNLEHKEHAQLLKA